MHFVQSGRRNAARFRPRPIDCLLFLFTVPRMVSDACRCESAGDREIAPTAMAGDARHCESPKGFPSGEAGSPSGETEEVLSEWLRALIGTEARYMALGDLFRHLLRKCHLPGACRPVRRGPAGPFDGGLPARSTGPAGPFSLKTVHRTVFRALEPLRTSSAPSGHLLQ